MRPTHAFHLVCTTALAPNVPASLLRRHHASSTSAAPASAAPAAAAGWALGAGFRTRWAQNPHGDSQETSRPRTKLCIWIWGQLSFYVCHACLKTQKAPLATPLKSKKLTSLIVLSVTALNVQGQVNAQEGAPGLSCSLPLFKLFLNCAPSACGFTESLLPATLRSIIRTYSQMI